MVGQQELGPRDRHIVFAIAIGRRFDDQRVERRSP